MATCWRDCAHRISAAVKSRNNTRTFKICDRVQLSAVTCLQRTLFERKFNGNAERAFALKRCLSAFVPFLVFLEFFRLLLLKVENCGSCVF